MSGNRRPSAQTTEVLGALARAPREWRHGYDLGREVGVRSGSLYPILMRLSDRGLLEARWETEPSPGRPPRHLYRLTPAGLAFASEWARSSAAASASTGGRRTRSAGGGQPAGGQAGGQGKPELRGAW